MSPETLPEAFRRIRSLEAANVMIMKKLIPQQNHISRGLAVVGGLFLVGMAARTEYVHSRLESRIRTVEYKHEKAQLVEDAVRWNVTLK